ncbi:MAG TPA: NDP-sugar synthase [Solirubrobacteraceae bacterium]|nr:NDP-sugar synthase [Solirubrobacteraceae bacterium]
MQAVILAGGQGTRLRPLTSNVPKPVVTLVDRPFISFMLEWLRGHGITRVVLSCGFLADGVRDVLGDGASLGIEIVYIEEPEPLGTAGAVKLAAPLLDETFLMLNGDVLTDIDITAQLAAHRASGARATLALVPVADPSPYGLVLRDARGAVREFVEKPQHEIPGENLISAGVYVLQREILELVPSERKVSIEHEVWPHLVGNGLFAYASESYWLDIGTPERYLQGTFDIIAGDLPGAPAQPVAGDATVEGRVLEPCVIGAGAHVAAGATVGPCAVIGPRAKIAAGARVESAVVLDDAVVGADSRLRNCVLAPGSTVGERCELDGNAVLGEGAALGADNALAGGARIFPGVRLPDGAIAF